MLVQLKTLIATKFKAAKEKGDANRVSLLRKFLQRFLLISKRNFDGMADFLSGEHAVILAMHLKVITIAEAMNCFQRGYSTPKEAQNFYANVLGDSLLAMVKEEMELVNDELFSSEIATTAIKDLQGLRPGSAAHAMLLILAKHCNPGYCHDEPKVQEIWANLGTIYLSGYLASLMNTTSEYDEFMKLMVGLQEVGQSVVYAAGFSSKDDHRHALLINIKRNALDYEVRVYNTGSGKVADDPIEAVRGYRPAEAILPIRTETYQPSSELRHMSPADLKKAHYFRIKDDLNMTEEQAIELLYPTGRKADHQAWREEPWAYTQEQKAGTCSASAIFAWLRSLGLVGLQTELTIKKKVIASLWDLPKDSFGGLFEQHPGLREALVVNSINELIIYYLYLLNWNAKPVVNALFANSITDLVTPFKNQPVILDGFADPLRKLAKLTQNALPDWFPKEEPLRKRAILSETIAQLIGLECLTGKRRSERSCSLALVEGFKVLKRSPSSALLSALALSVIRLNQDPSFLSPAAATLLYSQLVQVIGFDALLRLQKEIKIVKELGEALLEKAHKFVPSRISEKKCEDLKFEFRDLNLEATCLQRMHWNFILEEQRD